MTASENGNDAGSEDVRAATEYLDMLIDDGVFEGYDDVEVLIEELRSLATKGVHPRRVLKSWGDNIPLLKSFDLAGVAKYIREMKCKNIVVMCGAGISTAAGIPDFRSPGTGLYDNLQKFDLDRPEDIFDLDFFKGKPGAFYELCKEIWPGQYEPTVTHFFIKLLHDKGLLRRCYTQNIDSLECLTGLPFEKCVAAHGNFDEAHVLDSDPEVLVDIDEVKEAITGGGEAGWIALREKWGNLVKPKIVFFGESLPRRFFELAGEDLKQCDLLIVLGTSLVVFPFAGLVGMVADDVPRLLVNRDPVGRCEMLQNGFTYHLDKNKRDVWHGGSCDEGCQELARLLAWDQELEDLVAKGASSKG